MAQTVITLDNEELQLAVVQYLSRQGWELKLERVAFSDSGTTIFARVFADSSNRKPKSAELYFPRGD